jgi:hypothetical protein
MSLLIMQGVSLGLDETAPADGAADRERLQELHNPAQRGLGCAADQSGPDQAAPHQERRCAGRHGEVHERPRVRTPHVPHEILVSCSFRVKLNAMCCVVLCCVLL